MPLPSDAIALGEQPVSKLPADAIALPNIPVSDPLTKLEDDPMSSVFQPAAKTYTGKSFEERAQERDYSNLQPKDAPFDRNLGRVKNAAMSGVVGGQIADMATTPFDYAGGPLLELGGAAIGAAGKALGGAKDAISKSASSYVTDVVAPKAYQMYQDAVSKFTPEIQRFSEKLNIPKSAIETIKNSGVQKVMNTRQQLGDSTDSIVQRLNSGVQNFRNNADLAYKTAIDSAPEGKSINIRPSITEAGNSLKKLGLITKNGNLTELGSSEIARDSVYAKLLDFYKSADSISGVKGIKAKAGVTGVDSISGKGGADLTTNQGSKLINSRFATNVNKEQFQFLRDKLNSLYKNKPSDTDVGKVVNQFYSDGESSGIKGLQNARVLQRKAFDVEDNYTNLIKEKSFDRFHNLPQEQVRKMQDLERKIGVNFVDDLRDLSAGKYLDKLNEFNKDKFVTDLNAASDPKMTNYIKSKYEDLLGKSKADEIFKDVIASRRGRQIKTAGKVIAGLGVAEGARRVVTDKIFGN